jgi:hypothetical protein
MVRSDQRKAVRKATGQRFGGQHTVRQDVVHRKAIIYVLHFVSHGPIVKRTTVPKDPRMSLILGASKIIPVKSGPITK